MNSTNRPLNMLANKSNTEDQSQPQPASNHHNLVIANLFNSLSSLAGSSQNERNHSAPSSIMSSHQACTRTTPTSANSPPISAASHSQTLALQSVLAAAMMQQQLAITSSAANPIAMAQQPPPLMTSCSVAPTQGPVGGLFEQQAQQLGGLFGHADSFGGRQPSQQTQAPPPQQRINYCTICNKELCNKYFMKTHMLKMHGINLEMEQSAGSTEEKGGDESATDLAADDNEDQVEPSERHQTDDSAASEYSIYGVKQEKKQAKSNPNSNPKGKTQTGKQTTSVLNGFAGNSMGGVVCDICNKELCSKYFLKVHKQNTHGIMTDYQDMASQFMYPFAAAPTGTNPFAPAGPVGGILSSAQAQPVPPSALDFFAPPPQHSSSGVFGPGETNRPMNLLSDERTATATTKRTSGNKRLKLSRSPHIDQAASSASEAGGQAQDPNQQLSSVYRLLLAQQQQQSSPPGLMGLDPISANQLGALMCFGAMGPPNLFVPPTAAAMSPAMIVDNILRNQHLFNRKQAPNPAQPIDRNNNSGGGGGGKPNGKKISSASSCSKDGTNSSKYFSHYTEACPMCDRRFKSIKWLKTHMMNDHKQEIGAYMQMMMQCFFTSKSQQMAAAATIATIEQQNLISQQQERANSQASLHLPALNRHHPQPEAPQPQQQQRVDFIGECLSFHQHQAQSGHPQSPPASESLMDLIKRQHQFGAPHSLLRPDFRRARGAFGQPPNQSSPLGQPQLEAQDFSLDAGSRCRTSASSDSELQSPISPGSRTVGLSSVSGRATESQLDPIKLNFELSKLASLKSEPDDYTGGRVLLHPNDTEGEEEEEEDEEVAGGGERSARQIQIKSSGD